MFMLKQMFAAVTLGLWIVLPAAAQDMTDASLQLCEKVKTCALARMNEEELTPETREMMQPMLDNMCVKLQQGMGEAPDGHPAYAPAEACMRSMTALSCEALLSGEDSKTAECEAYEKIARDTYISQPADE